MGCGGSEDKHEAVEVHEPEECCDDTVCDETPTGTPISVFVGGCHRVDLWTCDDNTVCQVIDKVNAVLKDYEGYSEVDIMALSSKWALGDHLEYCGEDKLCELDGYDEGKSAKTLFFLGVEPACFAIESYDAHGDDYYTCDDFWKADDKHRLTVTDSF